jgi:hypothetical protein
MSAPNLLCGLLFALLSFAPEAGAQTGLIEHLPLNGNGSALVGTSGTLVGGPTAAPDSFGTPGGALSFAGTPQQYVNVAGGGGLNNLQTGTISLLVKWTGTQDAGPVGAGFGHVLGRQGNGVFSNNMVGLSTNNPATARVIWQPYGTAFAITGSTIVGNGQWHHVAISFSSGSHRLYVDGVLDGSSSTVGSIRNSATTPLTIGAWIGDGSSFSTSVIDDFRLYNRVLTQAEVIAIFNTPPTAVAGPDRAAFDRDVNNARTTVVLDGTASSDPQNTPLTYSWVQTAGPAVTLSGANTAAPSFLAPDMSNHPYGEPPPISFTFRLTVSDGVFTSDPDDVVVTVKHFNLPPTAVAYAPAAVPEGTPVTLDGTASADGDGDPLSYVWTQVSGTPVNLPSNATNNPTLSFSSDVPGPHAIAGEELQFTLTVSDGIESHTTAPVSVFIQNVNHAPIASADPVAPVFDNAGLVRLSGSGADADGDPVSFRWQQVAGTPVTLIDANTARPSFIAPAVEPAQGTATLTFAVISNDASAPGDPAALDSTPATVDVVVKHGNRAPIANAGTDINVPENAMVTLDGSGSYDPDNDAITYNWQQTAGAVVALDTTDPVHPKFTSRNVGPAGDSLTFRLVVTDTAAASTGSSLSSAPDTVNVHVQNVNQNPVAVISAPAAPAVGEGSVVLLDGSQSSDPDDNAITYAWSQTSGPAVSLSDPAAAQPTFVAPEVDRFGATVVFALQTKDEFGALSNVATTSVAISNINHPPTVDPGVLQSVPEDAAVNLAGLGLDPDAEENPLLTYAWTQTQGPAVALTGANTPNPTFQAPTVPSGSGGAQPSVMLKFTLTVTDPNGATASAETTVNVANVDHAPLANAGGIYLTSEGAAVTLNGTASSDPDGDALSYTWVQTGGPAVALANAGTATPSFTAPLVDAAGATLKFQLTVNDGLGGTSSDTATVNVANVNAPPVLVNPRPSIATLWPPNHCLVKVSILGVVDPNNDAKITITSVKQDEATDGLGDGDTAIDAIINADGTVLLRAERAALGNGRVYHVRFTAADSESSVSGEVKVSVPRNKSTDKAGDGGELYDSTKPTPKKHGKAAAKLEDLLELLSSIFGWLAC